MERMGSRIRGKMLAKTNLFERKNPKEGKGGNLRRKEGETNPPPKKKQNQECPFCWKDSRGRAFNKTKGAIEQTGALTGIQTQSSRERGNIFLKNQYMGGSSLWKARLHGLSPGGQESSNLQEEDPCVWKYLHPMPPRHKGFKGTKMRGKLFL